MKWNARSSGRHKKSSCWQESFAFVQYCSLQVLRRWVCFLFKTKTVENNLNTVSLEILLLLKKAWPWSTRYIVFILLIHRKASCVKAEYQIIRELYENWNDIFSRLLLHKAWHKKWEHFKFRVGMNISRRLVSWNACQCNLSATFKQSCVNIVSRQSFAACKMVVFPSLSS